MADKKNILFFGTPEFAAVSLKALINCNLFHIKLVVTQPDKPAGRGGKVKSSEVKDVAISHNMPVFQPSSLKKSLAESIKEIKNYGDFDIGVVVAFGQILPQEILDLPKAGCVNVHGSLLPRWRGAAPMQRAIMSGDKETGICLMKMDAGLDTGDIYCEEKTSITPEDNFETIHNRLSEIGANLLTTNLSKIIEKQIPATKQPEHGVTYAAKIKSEECLINWNKPAEEINRLIRALSPFPGAYTFINGKRLKIFKAQVKSLSQPGNKECGQIYYVDKQQFEIVCQGSCLSLREVQLEGKKRMLAGEFLNGILLTQNDKLTDS